MKDVEYSVDDAGGKERIFNSFDKAADFAVNLAVSNGKTVNLNILVFSKAGARRVLGDEGVERYENDPEASVFTRIAIKAEDLGSVA
jgi:hypothetical protein